MSKAEVFIAMEVLTQRTVATVAVGKIPKLLTG